MTRVQGWLADFLRDVRVGWRGLLRHQSFAVAAVATLAIALGANTAVFSVVDGVLLKRLPFEDPDRLVQLYGTPALRGQAVDRFEDLRAQSTSFDALVAYAVGGRYVRTPDGPERAMVVSADRGFFALLGVAPLAGRTFRADDSSSVAVVSERFWRERLHSNPSIIGTSLTIDNAVVTIIGVMPAAFQFPYGAASVLPGVAAQTRTDLWVPGDPPADPALRARIRVSNATGRLKRGVTIEQAESELAVITGRFAAERPDPNGARGVRLERLADVVVAPPVRRTLFVLWGSVAIVLALACANVANLSLVRAALRRRDVAAMIAVGATPARVLRQCLTEHLVLAVFGGAAGLAVAWWSGAWFARLAAAHLPRASDIALDSRVFAFLFCLCLVVSVVAGVAPALFAARTDPRALMEDGGGHATAGVGLRRLRDALIVAEVAAALVLAIGATLLVRELYRVRRTDPGMRTSNVVTLHLGRQPALAGVNRRGAPPDVETRAYYDIAARVQQIPGVKSAGFTQVLPLQNWGWTANSLDLRIQGRDPRAVAPFSFEQRYVTPGYFEALSIPLRSGRGFTDRDTRDVAPVVIVNETMARHLGGGSDVVNLVTSRGQIVGVAADVRSVNLDQASPPELYYPLAQNYSQLSELGMTLVVHTDSPVDSRIAAIRAAVHELGPELAVFDVKTMDRVMEDSLAPFSLFLNVMLAFAAVAVALALTGTYGVMSYVTASRLREFGLRAALGAHPRQIAALVLGHGARLTAIGLALGIALTLAAAPLLEGLPVSVRGPDVRTMVPVSAAIAIVALVACALPLRRAASPDLSILLRAG